MKKIFRMAMMAMLFVAFIGFAAVAGREMATVSAVSDPNAGSGSGDGEGESGDNESNSGETGGNGSSGEQPGSSEVTNPTNPSNPSGNESSSTPDVVIPWDGSNSCGGSSNPYDKDLEGMIGGTPVGGVIQVTKEDGRNSLDLDMLKKVVDRDLTLVMEYTYGGVDYRIVIPGKAAALDETVPIYGPLYLAAHYSSNAAVDGGSGATYTISKGDTLSKIAAANGTTVAALLSLNPEIKDVNVIYVGQSINVK